MKLGRAPTTLMIFILCGRTIKFDLFFNCFLGNMGHVFSHSKEEIDAKYISKVYIAYQPNFIKTKLELIVSENFLHAHIYTHVF